MTARVSAYRAVEQLDRSSGFITPLLSQSPDRETVHAHVVGMFRWRGQLDFVIEQFAGRSIRKLDESTLRVLRLALHELRYMRSAQHAVVSEWVTIATRFSHRSTGLVNAVLRRATRENPDTILPPGDSPAALAVRYSHPEWMVQRWIRNFGIEEATAILVQNQMESSPDIFVDTTRTSMDEVEQFLSKQTIVFERSSLVPSMLRIKGSTSPLAALIADGKVHPLDEGSAAVAFSVPAASTIIDLAAAPGGKSLLLASRGMTVISNDISFGRTALMKKILSRGSRPPRVVTSDGTAAPFRMTEGVLLDAPCSATGTLRKNPEVKWRLQEEELPAFAAVQKTLLSKALELSARFCVYSTCSLEPEENDEVIAEVLSGNSDFDLSTRFEPSSTSALRDSRLFFSPAAGTDGFFVHLLERR